LKSILAIISTLLALIAGVLTVLWAYTKFILERGLIPATELSLESNFVGFQSGKAIVEILVHLKNKGTSTLIAKNIRVDVRYLKDEETIEPFDYTNKKAFGRVNFRHSLRNDFFNLGDDTDKDRIQKMGDQRGFKIIQHDTFVQAGIDQVYSFTIALPDDSTYYLVYSSFEYAQRPSGYQRGIIKLSRQLGLIQYSLHHISEAHSIERVFSIPQ
jgi:hypothetical protein